MSFASYGRRIAHLSTFDAKETKMIEERKGGEGNREADRRYRKGVRETVEETSEEERSRKARDLDRDDLDEARQAEEKGKSRAKK
jgi:hypothetical protein